MLLVPRLSTPVTATWAVPGSKSITNRAFVLAALAEGTTILENVLEADDTRHMRTALAALGIDSENGAPGQVLIHGGRSRLRPAKEPIFIGNSGTTVRFLTALACVVPGQTTLVGDVHMAKRPIADLVTGLRQLGVRIDCASGCPPLTIHGGRLSSGSVTMPGDRSSQYFSALLLSGGLADGVIDVNVTGTLVSRPYIDMTLRMVHDFGGKIDKVGEGFRIHPSAAYRPRSYHIEPDASAASYPFALAAATKSRITVPGLTEASLQGDYAFTQVLSRMGAHISSDRGGTTVQGGDLTGVDADLFHLSDTVMSLAAIAPLANSPTTIRNIANIRIKETDRLIATVTELRRCGVTVEYGDDWMRVFPGPTQAASIHCYADHRMAMAFAILGAVRGGLTITDPLCTAKTYPDYFAHLLTILENKRP